MQSHYYYQAIAQFNDRDAGTTSSIHRTKEGACNDDKARRCQLAFKVRRYRGLFTAAEYAALPE